MEILEIIRSKTRKEILGYYFLHPAERFYLRQLEKILGLPVGNIRRELRHLENLGMFLCEKVGNMSFYFLNKNFPFYSEIKTIILKTIGVGNIFKTTISRIEGINFAFIYGSFAKGSEIKGSDIDFMVIGNIDQKKLITSVKKIEDKIGRAINPTTYSIAEFKEKIKNRNRFILNVMKDKKMMIIGKEDELKRLGK
jgi:predicted nucleotidyltransferase